MTTSLPSLKSAVTPLLIAILAIPFTLLFQIGVVLIALPLKLYCKLVNTLAHLVDPEIEKVLTGLAAGQGRDFDDICFKPCTTEVTCLMFRGTVGFEKIKDIFERRVVIKLNNRKAYPTLQFPELQQYLTMFMGYLCLKKDPNFDFSNHITFHNEGTRDKPVTREDLLKIREYYMTKPFVKNRSPWELVFIDNYIPSSNELDTWNKNDYSKIGNEEVRCSAVLFRMHHALGDGFSVQNMLTFMADNPYQTTFPIKFTPYQKSLLNLRALTLGPYDWLKLLLKADGFHALHRPVQEHSGDYYIVESELFSTKRVKLIKEKFGVSFTAIMVALISGGIRTYLVEYNKPIPRNMGVAIPFATAEHSDTFSNEFSLTSISYPVHLDDPRERVEHIHNQFKSLLSTSLIRMSDFIIDICGCLPLRLFRRLTETAIYSSTYSTMPGPKEGIQCFRHDMLEVNYTYGTNSDSPGFGISSITYKDNFRFVLFIDTNLIGSRSAAKDLMQYISEEFDVLEQYGMPNSKHVETGKSSLSEEELRMKEWEESVQLD